MDDMDEIKVDGTEEGIVENTTVLPTVLDRDADDSRMSGSPASQKGSISEKTYSPEVMNKANNLEKRVLMLTARAEQNQDVLILDPDTGVIVNEDENSSSSSTVYDQMLGRKGGDEQNHRKEDHSLIDESAQLEQIKEEQEVAQTKPFDTSHQDEHMDGVTVVTVEQDHGEHPVGMSHGDVKDEVKPVLSCSYCPRAFTHVGHLKRHMNMHAPDKQLTCEVCGKIFKRTDKFRIHMRIHTGERPHVCFVCDKRFNRAHHLTRHLLIHVRQGVINIDMVKGKGAIKEIVDDRPLSTHTGHDTENGDEVTHVKMEESDQVIVATEVQDDYISDEEEIESKLSEHEQEDDSEVVIILSEEPEGEGSEVIHSPEKYSASQSTQHGQSPRRKAKPKKIYNCQHCDKIFDRPSRLITHLSNHILEKGKNGLEEDAERLDMENEEDMLIESKEDDSVVKITNFSCDECGKVFPRQDRLNIHLRTHTGEKPYVCQICERRFSRSHHLSRHILTHSGIKNYRCKFCLKWYSTAYYLKEHMQIRHAEDLAKEGGLANVDFSPQKEPLVMKKEGIGGKDPAHAKYLVSETGELLNRKSGDSNGNEVREFIITENGEIVEGGKDDDFGGSPGDRGQVFVVVPQETVEMKAGGAGNANNMAKLGKPPKVFSCEYCGKTFSTSSHLKRHTYNHTGDKPHGCTECGKRFARMDKLRIHYRIHSGERPYSCQLCKKTFARSDLLSRHMFLHPEAISFNTKAEFGDGMKNTDGSGGFSEGMLGGAGAVEQKDAENKYFPFTNLIKREPKEKRLHPCPECGKVFPRPSRLAAHLRLHSGEKPYECKECGKKFTRANHLNVHHRIHTGERPHVCQVCSRGFNRSHHLQRHMLIHTGEKPFPCQYCEKRYSRAAHLKDHMLNHHKEIMLAMEGPGAIQGTPFISRLSESQPSMVTEKNEGIRSTVVSERDQVQDYKGEGTSQRDSGGQKIPSLLEAKQDNTGVSEFNKEVKKEGVDGMQLDKNDDKLKQVRDVKLYPCKHCDMVFHRQSHFERHVLLHDGKKPYECDECGKGFAGKDRLRVHKRIHTGERPYVCTICSKSFGRSHHLKRHLVSHSGVKPFQCEFCEKRYSASYHLKDHMNNHHVLEMALKQEQETGKSETLSFTLVNNDNEGSAQVDVKVEGVEEPIREITTKDEGEGGSGGDGDFAKETSTSGGLSGGDLSYADDEDEDATKENDKSTKHKLSRAHQCPHCDRIFDRPSRLQSHLYTHTGEKPHTCEDCGKSFGGLDRLRVHRRIHTGLKPHICKICFKAFGRAYHLSRHMMSHGGSKLFHCVYCDKKFTTSSYLKQHKKTAHSSEPGYTSEMDHTSEGQGSDADDILEPREGSATTTQEDVAGDLGGREENTEQRGSLSDFYDSMNLSDQLLFLVGQEAVKSQSAAHTVEKSATLTPLNDPTNLPNKALQQHRESEPDITENVSSEEQGLKEKSLEEENKDQEEKIKPLVLKDAFICNICGESCENAGSFFYHREQHRLSGGN